LLSAEKVGLDPLVTQEAREIQEIQEVRETLEITVMLVLAAMPDQPVILELEETPEIPVIRVITAQRATEVVEVLAAAEVLLINPCLCMADHYLILDQKARHLVLHSLFKAVDLVGLAPEVGPAGLAGIVLNGV
jgi:hypothetical protein